MSAIIVAIDYSEACRNALRYAAELAKAKQSTLVLYHAFTVSFANPEVPISGASTSIENLTKENLISLETLAEEIKSTFSLPIEFFTSGDPFHLQLPKLVKNKHAELVVLGKKYGDNWEYRFYRSTVVNIMWHAGFPLLLVPEDFPFVKPVCILFAFDQASITPHTHLQLLKELAQIFKAQVRVLHIEETVNNGTIPAEVSKRRQKINLEKIFEGVKHHFVTIAAAHVVEGIDQVIYDYHPDLLVLAPRQHPFWEVITHKSNTRKMTLHSKIPVLILPAIPHF